MVGEGISWSKPLEKHCCHSDLWVQLRTCLTHWDARWPLHSRTKHLTPHLPLWSPGTWALQDTCWETDLISVLPPRYRDTTLNRSLNITMCISVFTGSVRKGSSICGQMGWTEGTVPPSGSPESAPGTLLPLLYHLTYPKVTTTWSSCFTLKSQGTNLKWKSPMFKNIFTYNSFCCCF